MLLFLGWFLCWRWCFRGGGGLFLGRGLFLGGRGRASACLCCCPGGLFSRLVLSLGRHQCFFLGLGLEGHDLCRSLGELCRHVWVCLVFNSAPQSAQAGIIPRSRTPKTGLYTIKKSRTHRGVAFETPCNTRPMETFVNVMITRTYASKRIKSECLQVHA